MRDLRGGSQGRGEGTVSPGTLSTPDPPRLTAFGGCHENQTENTGALWEMETTRVEM